jgi:two-component system OmpR family response regulator
MNSLKRILFVEDDPDIQVIGRLALESVGGMTVCVCGSGAEALQAAQEFAPDLILLDVMMPVMDGPTTLAALRSLPSLASTPAIFMTARAQRYELEQYRSLGAIDVIAKPFDPMALPSLVSSIWSRRHG